MSGYPVPRVTEGRCVSRSWQCDDSEPPKATVVLPYIRGLFESLCRVLASHRLLCVTNLQNTQRHPHSSKNPVPPGKVSKVTCVMIVARLTYVGHTERTLSHHHNEHIRALRNVDPYTLFSGRALSSTGPQYHLG